MQATRSDQRLEEKFGEVGEAVRVNANLSDHLAEIFSIIFKDPQQAERLMLMEGASIDTASMIVGYESASQFSREYKRLFGVSPRDDINRKRKLKCV